MTKKKEIRRTMKPTQICIQKQSTSKSLDTMNTQTTAAESDLKEGKAQMDQPLALQTVRKGSQLTDEA